MKILFFLSIFCLIICVMNMYLYFRDHNDINYISGFAAGCVGAMGLPISFLK